MNAFTCRSIVCIFHCLHGVGEKTEEPIFFDFLFKLFAWKTFSEKTMFKMRKRTKFRSSRFVRFAFVCFAIVTHKNTDKNNWIPTKKFFDRNKPCIRVGAEFICWLVPHNNERRRQNIIKTRECEEKWGKKL